MVQEIRFWTLKYIHDSNVGESTLPSNNPFKKYTPIISLRSVNKVN